MTLIDMLTSVSTVSVQNNWYKWVHNSIQYIAILNPKNGCIQVSNGLVWKECYRKTPIEKVYAEFSL